METNSIDQFGKHHWSLLAFIETRTVDFQGQLDFDRMRCNREKHPIQLGPSQQVSSIHTWQENWGTRLRSGEILSDHDDWDVLDDLEAAGLTIIISQVHGIVALTELGINIAQQLRTYKAQGGNFKDFQVQQAQQHDAS